MKNRNKMLALGALACAGISVLILIVVLGLRSASMNPTSNSEDSNSKTSETAKECEILTYSNDTYTGFSFDYDSCEWEVSEKATESTQDYLPKFNSYEVRIKDKRTAQEDSGFITVGLTPNLVTGYGPTCLDATPKTVKISDNILRNNYATTRYTYLGIDTELSDSCPWPTALSALNTNVETNIASEGFKVVLNTYPFSKLGAIVTIDSNQGNGDYLKYADELVKSFQITEMAQTSDNITVTPEITTFNEGKIFNISFDYSKELGAPAVSSILMNRDSKWYCVVERYEFSNGIAIVINFGLTTECGGGVGGDNKLIEGANIDFDLYRYEYGDYGANVTLNALAKSIGGKTSAFIQESQEAYDGYYSILISASGLSKAEEEVYTEYISEIVRNFDLNVSNIKTLNADTQQ